MVRGSSNNIHSIASKIVRQIVLPELQREVNEDKNFAPLRQVYSGMILAAWFKRALNESLLGKIYANRSKTKGVDQDPRTNEEIYHQYLKAYKKGVFNFIKEDVDILTNETTPRKYFSGGTEGWGKGNFEAKAMITYDFAMAEGNIDEIKPKLEVVRETMVGMRKISTALFSKRLHKVALLTALLLSPQMTHAVFAQTPPAVTFAGQQVLEPPPAPQSASENKSKEEISPSITMLRVRALRDDKEAMDAIKEGAKDKLDYAWALYALHNLGLEAAQSEIQSGSFNEYFTRVSKGDLRAFAFLREISSENRGVQRRMRTMDIGGIERRARGEEKGEVDKHNYIDVLFEMAGLKLPTALPALRNLPTEGLDEERVKELVSYGNMMAIAQIGKKFEKEPQSILTGFDKGLDELMTGEMNDKNIYSLSLFVYEGNRFIHAETKLRGSGMENLVKAALDGNEKAMNLCFDMIETLGHERVADGLIRGNITGFEEQIKKGNLTAYKIFMQLYKFGNIFAPNDLVNLDISRIKALAEQGNREAIDALMELDAYGHSQAGMDLGTLDLTEFIKLFDLRSLTMDDVDKLAKLNFTYQNPGAIGAYATLDFTKIPMNLSKQNSRDFNLKAAESGSTGTRAGLSAMDLIAADVFGQEKDLSKEKVDPNQLNWIDGLYQFAKNLDIRSAKELIVRLDPEALGQDPGRCPICR